MQTSMSGVFEQILGRADLGVVGLGVMGSNVLLHLSDAGFAVAGYDRDPSREAALAHEARQRSLLFPSTPKQLATFVRRPRTLLLFLPAGDAVDAVLEELVPLLDSGDVVIDAGNSHFTDTDRRGRMLAERGLHLLGLGVSGGESGARRGASLMAGGPREAYARVRPQLEAAAARVDGEPCLAWLGPGGAGHYVKMVHNGIEYGLMELIAEIYDLASRGLRLSSFAISQLFGDWSDTDIGGYLVEITADILSRNDERTGRPMVEVIRDVARQKGTGQWTSQEALDLQIPVPTIDAAVSMRDFSALPEREEIHGILGSSLPHVPQAQSAPATAGEQLRRALHAGMVLTFAQGFALLRAASLAHDYQLQLSEVARIWRGGCIIRSRLLEKIRAAYRAQPRLVSLLADQSLSDQLTVDHPALREAVRLAVNLEIPVPGLMASLSYLEAFRSARLPASLIQAQRDYFGAHTYERVDESGTFHTDWAPS